MFLISFMLFVWMLSTLISVDNQVLFMNRCYFTAMTHYQQLLTMIKSYEPSILTMISHYLTTDYFRMVYRHEPLSISIIDSNQSSH